MGNAVFVCLYFREKPLLSVDIKMTNKYHPCNGIVGISSPPNPKVEGSNPTRGLSTFLIKMANETIIWYLLIFYKIVTLKC